MKTKLLILSSIPLLLTSCTVSKPNYLPSGGKVVDLTNDEELNEFKSTLAYSLDNTYKELGKGFTVTSKINSLSFKGESDSSNLQSSINLSDVKGNSELTVLHMNSTLENIELGLKLNGMTGDLSLKIDDNSDDISVNMESASLSFYLKDNTGYLDLTNNNLKNTLKELLTYAMEGSDMDSSYIDLISGLYFKKLKLVDIFDEEQAKETIMTPYQDINFSDVSDTLLSTILDNQEEASFVIKKYNDYSVGLSFTLGSDSLNDLYSEEDMTLTFSKKSYMTFAVVFDEDGLLKTLHTQIDIETSSNEDEGNTHQTLKLDSDSEFTFGVTSIKYPALNSYTEPIGFDL